MTTTTHIVYFKVIVSALALAMLSAHCVARDSKTASRNSTTPSRVCFVDIQSVMKEAIVVQNLKQKINAEFKAKTEKHQMMRREYENILKEIQLQKDFLSQQVLDAKHEQAFVLKARIDKEKYEIDKFLQRSETEILPPTHDLIIKTIAEVARSEGYDMAFRREYLLYGSDAVDISDQVIARLNADAVTSPTLPLSPSTKKED